MISKNKSTKKDLSPKFKAKADKVIKNANKTSQSSIETESVRETQGKVDKPITNPTLFPDKKINPMASALPIWEASNILTQRTHLQWQNDPNGKLRYTRDIGDGAIHFWVTDNLKDENPAALAGAAALAVIDTFDIRAACMHLIYAAHATQLERPWEQELIISDRQIETYLGLQNRKDKTRQEKLALIEEIAKQPCQIKTFISHPTQGKSRGFTIEEGRLWHTLGKEYHYEQNLFGEKELTGITFTIKPGLWARHFLNEEDITTRTQQGYLSKTILENVMSIWQRNEGAARLMMWLLFKTQLKSDNFISVHTLMEVAYGSEKLHMANTDRALRKKLISLWDSDLLILHQKGWTIEFDPATYPPEIQPIGFGRIKSQRPKGFFALLLQGFLSIFLRDILPSKNEIKALCEVVESVTTFNCAQVKALRLAKGLSQRQLASMSKISQGLICLIEKGERSISPDNQEILQRILQS